MIRKKLLLILSLFLLSIQIASFEKVTLKSYIGVYKLQQDLIGCTTTIEIPEDNLIALVYKCRFPSSLLVKPNANAIFFQCNMEEMSCTTLYSPTDTKDQCHEASLKFLINGDIVLLNPCTKKSYYLKKKRTKICL